MIEGLCVQQRASPELFAAGLSGWIRGEESEETEAASINIAALLLLWRKTLNPKVP